MIEVLGRSSFFASTEAVGPCLQRLAKRRRPSIDESFTSHHRISACRLEALLALASGRRRGMPRPPLKHRTLNLLVADAQSPCDGRDPTSKLD